MTLELVLTGAVILIGAIYIYVLEKKVKTIKYEVKVLDRNLEIAEDSRLNWKEACRKYEDNASKLILVNEIQKRILNVIVNEPFESLVTRLDFGEDTKTGLKIKLNEDKTGYILSDTKGVLLNRSIIFEKKGTNLTDLSNNLDKQDIKALESLLEEINNTWN